MLPHLGLALEVELGGDERLGVRRLGQHHAPRVDDHRPPARAVAARVLADLVGGDHERLVLDRAGAQEHLPVVARGGERERGGHGDHARAAHREDAVQLGEAQVVADRQAELDAVGGLRQHDLLAAVLVLGLAVRAPADLDVEHVDLAVDRADFAVGADVHRGVGALLAPGDALRDRAGHEVDAELPRGRARPGQGGPVERLGARGRLLRRPQHGPLLRQHHELGARGRGRAREPVGGGEVALAICGGRELDGGGAHEGLLPRD